MWRLWFGKACPSTRGFLFDVLALTSEASVLGRGIWEWPRAWELGLFSGGLRPVLQPMRGQVSSWTKGAVLLSDRPMLFISQSHALLGNPASICCPWMLWLSWTVSHHFVICVLIAFGWFYRYDGKFPTIRKVGQGWVLCWCAAEFAVGFGFSQTFLVLSTLNGVTWPVHLEG